MTIHNSSRLFFDSLNYINIWNLSQILLEEYSFESQQLNSWLKYAHIQGKPHLQKGDFPAIYVTIGLPNLEGFSICSNSTIQTYRTSTKKRLKRHR